jgi:hypothetical protein
MSEWISPDQRDSDDAPLSRISENERGEERESTGSISGIEAETWMNNREYGISDMGTLHMEYLRHGTNQTSISSRVSKYAMKESLLPCEILDKGNSRNSPWPRFTLEPTLLEELSITIAQMQSLLERSVSLLPFRKSLFIIDPKGSLYPVLEGAQSLAELNMAWLALHQRFGLADQFLEKYQREFRTLAGGVMPSSPVSTNPGVYD